MTSLNTQLWELIETHNMPEDAVGRPFTDQLMAENRISRETADVAISEYRKFMYLCATRDERNVPSKAVDLVWHLHMQHTRDYWDVFCPTLGKPVHHSPGGQGQDHLDDYKATVHAYMDLFGVPPKGIWKLNDRGETLATLACLAAFMLIGVLVIAQGENLLAGLLWLSIPLFMFAHTLYGTTTKGEFTFIFESGDPFADGDGGDCGSGDGGGCGD